MSKKITKLTDDQIARFPEFVDKWTKIGLSTEPADRPAAEAAIVDMYRIAKLAAPRIVWSGSPMGSALTRAFVLGLGKSIWASVGDSVGDSVWDSVRDSVCGQHEAGWLAFYDYFADVCGLTKETDQLRGLWGLAKSANWALPHQRICWVSDRHDIVRMDGARRIHATDGPAIHYPDGWSIYAVHGTLVPAVWIETPNVLTASVALGEPNAERRRAACELLGWHKVLEDPSLNPKIINAAEPHIGTLIQVDLPGAPEQWFLKFQCGTGRWFAEPVNDKTYNTALHANAAGNGWRPGAGDPLQFIPFIRS